MALEPNFQEESFNIGGPSEGDPNSVPAEALLDGPIPGQSLTGEPGNAPWESPPEIADPEEAVDFIFNNMRSEDNMRKLLDFMTAGVPLEAIAKTVTFAGFAEGHWTPDVAELIQPTVTLGLLNVALSAGITPTIEANGKDRGAKQEGDDASLARLMKTFKPEEFNDITSEEIPVDEGLQLEVDEELQLGVDEEPQLEKVTPQRGFLQGGVV